MATPGPERSPRSSGPETTTFPQPGGTLPFFGIAPTDLADTQVSPPDRAHLRERLAAGRTPGEVFDVLGRTLTGTATERTVHPAVARALATAEQGSGNLSAAGLAADAGVSRFFAATSGKLS